MMRTTILGFFLGTIVIATAYATPAQVIIIRHAEKPPEGNHLSLKGYERAAALVPYFLGDPELLKFGTPSSVFATKPSGPNDSYRPIETVEGVAKALKLNLIAKYERLEYPIMVKEILKNAEYDGKMILIAWEHKVIPNITEAFGVQNAPKEWHGDTFDRTWIITFLPDEKTEFQNLPQRLMFGDSSE